MESYDKWVFDPTPDNMGKVLKDLDYTLTREVQRYSGPKSLLRGQAKRFAIGAIKSYNPASKASLGTWVTSNLQQLNRYSNSINPVYTPEVTKRQAAELNTITTNLEEEYGRMPTNLEIADKLGMSVAKIKKLKKATMAVMHEGQRPVDPESGQQLHVGPVIPETFQEANEVIYDSLDARDKVIYDLKMGKGNRPKLTSLQIAKRLGVSPAFISQKLKDISHRILQTQKRIH